MLQPLFEDDPAGPRPPWLTLGIAGVWLAAFAAPLSPERFGLLPGAASWTALLLAPALHAGVVHLAVSLLWLAACLPALESRWGRPFTGGLLAALVALQSALIALGPAAARPVVGASAALAGLLAAATLRFARGGFRLRLGVPPHALVIALPGLALPGLWFVGEVALDAAAGLDGASRGRGYGAVGLSAALGLATAWAVAHFGLEESGWLRRRGPSALARRRATQLLARLAKAAEDEPPEIALGLLTQALRAPEPDARLAVALWQRAAACERHDDVVEPLLGFVAGAWRSGRREAALETWRSLLAERPAAPLELSLRLALAAALGEAGRRREAAQTLRGALAGELTPGSALRLAQAARPIHPDTAIEAARRALASPALEPAKRVKIEALIEALEAEPARLEELDLGCDPAPARPARSALELGEAPGPALASPDPRPEPSLDALDPHAIAPQDLGGDAAAGAELSEAESAALDGWELDPGPAESWELDAEPGDAVDALAAACAAAPRFASHKVVEATPLGVEDGALRLVAPGGQRSRLSLARVQAIAAGALRALDGEPAIVVDLLLNWNDAGDGPLHVARLRSDRLAAEPLGAAGSPHEALRRLAAELLDASDALPLPDAASARGEPFRRFESLAAYEREVLLVDG